MITALITLVTLLIASAVLIPVAIKVIGWISAIG